jgi:hypothetical protein
MVSQLIKNERQLAIGMSVLLALIGLAMAGAGRGDPFGVHGLIVLVYSLGMIFVVISGYHAPEPGKGRLARYYDDPIKAGIVFAMVWAVFGMFIGVWVAGLLAYPEMTFDAAWSSFGRLRPAHTSGVIFGFGGNALIATSFPVASNPTTRRSAATYTRPFRAAMPRGRRVPVSNARTSRSGAPLSGVFSVAAARRARPNPVEATAAPQALRARKLRRVDRAFMVGFLGCRGLGCWLFGLQ